MDPEISRRGFLALGGMAVVRESRWDRDEAVPWWVDCSTSPDYQRLDQATAAEGLIVSASETGTYSLSFIDDHFPVSTPIRLPRRLAQRELQVVGTVRCEMSLQDAGARPSLVVMFLEPADVTVYGDESKRGGVVIVAIETR